MAFLMPVFLPFSCISKKNNQPVEVDKFSYGVFLGIDEQEVDKITKYETVVIDAQYFSKENIQKLKDNNQTVYSYLNVGAIENFRSYYSDYLDITLGEYEHWEEERWVDVSQPKWQDFILNDLSVQLLDKGVDGLFIDNADVYYEFEEDPKLYDGLTTILTTLNEKTYISINGGDTYVNEYLINNGSLNAILDGVNQETVFSSIDWDTKTFSRQSEEERFYFQNYVEAVGKNHKDVYLLEYTTDEELTKEIEEYCQKNKFKYYISSSLELTI